MSQSSRFCEQCGARLSPGARFCEECGSPVDSVPPAPAVQAAGRPLAPAATTPTAVVSAQQETPSYETTTPAPSPIPAPATVSAVSAAAPPPVSPTAQAGAGGSGVGRLLVGSIGGVVIGVAISLAILTQGRMPDVTTLPFWPEVERVLGTTTPTARSAATAGPTAAPPSGTPSSKPAVVTTLVPGATTAPRPGAGVISINDLLGDWVMERLIVPGSTQIDATTDVSERTIRIERRGLQDLQMVDIKDNDTALVAITQGSGTQIRGTITNDENEPIRIACELSADRQILTIRFWTKDVPETGPEGYFMELRRTARVGLTPTDLAQAA